MVTLNCEVIAIDDPSQSSINDKTSVNLVMDSILCGNKV